MQDLSKEILHLMATSGNWEESFFEPKSLLFNKGGNQDEA
jgi:hypothetical protein